MEAAICPEATESGGQISHVELDGFGCRWLVAKPTMAAATGCRVTSLPQPQAHPEATGRCPLRRARGRQPVRLGHGLNNWFCEWRCPLTGPHRSTVTNPANYRV